MYDLKQVHVASSLKDAIGLLISNPNSIIVSGGTDVLIQAREGKLAGATLVSIHDIKELQGIQMNGEGTLFIGASTTFTKVTEHPLIQKHIPTLGFAADQVGGPQIRNMGTIGGNVCNGMTSADTASTLVAYDAVMVIAGPDQTRRLPISQFYKGVGKTALTPTEVLIAIEIPEAAYANYSGHYIKYAQRNAMDIATLGCSVNVKLDETKNHVADVRIAFGVAAPIPVRCPHTEGALKGLALDAELFAALKENILTDVTPRDSWRASRAYRIHLVKELSKRALRESILSCGGKINA